MHEYHFSKLNKLEQGYYLKLINAFKRGDATVTALPFMGKESVIHTISAVSFDHPEIFYVNFKRLKFERTFTGITYLVEYLFKSSFWERLSRETDEKIEAIVKTAHAARLRNDLEKCIWLHNYFIRNIQYNYDALRNPENNPNAFCVRGVVTEGRAVCEGIAKTFKILCDKLGIEAIIVSGTSTLEIIGNEIEHAWNIVKIDGLYTHVDVTWDIGISDVSKYTRFDYFCLSDEKIRCDHSFENNLYPVCATDKDSFFSKRGRSFKNIKSLREYVERELKKRNDVLYFRIDEQGMTFEELTLKVQQIVNKIASQYCNSQYYMEMVPNKSQKCFFFKIAMK